MASTDLQRSSVPPFSRIGQCSAIYINALAGDEPRCVRTEEKDRADDVVRFGKPPLRDATDQLALNFGICPYRLAKMGPGQTRAHRVDQYVQWGPLCSHAHGQHLHCRLARVIDPHHGPSPLRTYGRDIDDTPPALLGHNFGRCTAKEKSAFDVGVEDLVKSVFPKIHERPEEAAGRVVDQYADSTERFYCRLDKLINLVTLGHVRLFSYGFAATGANFFCHSSNLSDGSRRDHHLCPGLRQTQRNRLAYPFSSASDNSYLTRKIWPPIHPCAPPFSRQIAGSQVRREPVPLSDQLGTVPPPDWLASDSIWLLDVTII